MPKGLNDEHTLFLSDIFPTAYQAAEHCEITPEDTITGIIRPMTAPFEPNEDELARHWSLTSEDLAVIAACRGPDHRRRFAVQLCWLRAHGRFLDDYRRAPIKIVNHLSRQLGLPPVPLLDRAGRDPPSASRPSASAAIWA